MYFSQNLNQKACNLKCYEGGFASVQLQNKLQVALTHWPPIGSSLHVVFSGARIMRDFSAFLIRLIKEYIFVSPPFATLYGWIALSEIRIIFYNLCFPQTPANEISHESFVINERGNLCSIFIVRKRSIKTEITSQKISHKSLSPA